MQFIFGSAGAPQGQPVYLASNDVVLDSATSLFQADINFGNEAGGDRVLVIMYGSESQNARTHSAPKYDGVAGTLIGQQSLDIVSALTISASCWIESELPSSGGLKEFEMTLSGNNRGHMARAFLFKNVDQTTPAGTFQSTTLSSQTPTYQISLTAASLRGDAVILAVAMAVQGATYVTGDLKDNGSTMNDIVELIARNPGGTHTGGGPLASSHDIVPSTSEAYTWDCKFGSRTAVGVTVMTLVPLNGLTP